MVIIPKFHYRWNSISTAGIRRLDFADLTVLRSPFGPYFRHSDVPFRWTQQKDSSGAADGQQPTHRGISV